jgi:N-acetylglutamate synthase
MTASDPLHGLRPGMRAVVRHRIDRGVTDALGDLTAMDADTVSIRTRGALVVIDRATVVAAKQVPPRPSRRGAPHLAISMGDLERIMVHGWPPMESARLGGWLLRAAAGFTGRANSVLPLGDPGIPLPEAVDHCERWYHERGLAPLFALFGPEGFAVDEDPLGRELLGRSYRPFNPTMVLTAATRAIQPEAPQAGAGRVLLETAPSQRWWGAFAVHRWPDNRTATPAAARAVLSGSDDQLFASLEAGSAVLGIARVAFGHAWAGVSALHVGQDHRRAGVAGQLIGALAEASRARGIRSMYSQVLEANSPARALFTRLGFATHHEYRYLRG